MSRGHVGLFICTVVHAHVITSFVSRALLTAEQIVLIFKLRWPLLRRTDTVPPLNLLEQTLSREMNLVVVCAQGIILVLFLIQGVIEEVVIVHHVVSLVELELASGCGIGFEVLDKLLSLLLINFDLFGLVFVEVHLVVLTSEIVIKIHRSINFMEGQIEIKLK